VGFSAEDLMKAAKMLEHNLKAFTGPGSVADLQTRGLLTAQHLGDWDAGRALAGTAGQAHSQIAQAYQDFLTEYGAVIAALRAAARAYGEGEQASKHTVAQVGAPQPTVETARFLE
jgi:hypothetical protein